LAARQVTFMVYDNVDDPVTIRRLTPVDNALVLITTGRTDWDGDVDELPVDVFDRGTAVEFLSVSRRPRRSWAPRWRARPAATGAQPHLRFKVKHQITEEAEPSTIDAPFNFTDVESPAQMQVYNDLLSANRFLMLALIALALIVLLAWSTDSASDSPVGARDLVGMAYILVVL
jgi:hypothetical protein